MTTNTTLPSLPGDDPPPNDTDHPANNPAVHIPIREHRLRIQNRFLEKIRVSSEGCWEWTASCFRAGYGQFRVGETQMPAHRVAYRLFALDDVACDEVIRHRCPARSRSCCNPAHLIAGTHRENWLDALYDGDIDLKFTPAEIREIRQRYRDEDVTQTELAADYEVEDMHISRIIRRTRYDYVEDDLGDIAPGRGRDATLTLSEVRGIRRKYSEENVTQTELAEEHDVSVEMISRIMRGEYGDYDLDDIAPGQGRPGSLTDADVREIRRRYRTDDVTYADLAEEYPCGRTMIGKIVRRESYAHIQPEPEHEDDGAED